MTCARMLVVVAACSGTADRRPPLPPKPPVHTSPSWRVGPDRWTTTQPIVDVLGLDAGHAIAIVGAPWNEWGPDRLGIFGNGLASIDLVTGAVVEHADLARPPAGFYAMARPSGGRVVVFGVDGGHEAAWTVDPTTLALVPLAVPEPIAPTPELAVGRSLDDTRVAICAPGQGTVVRDVATLAILERIPASKSCPWSFPGEGRVGPNGQKLIRPGSFWHLYTADDRDIGEIRNESIRWRGDGNGAIAIDRGELVSMTSSGPIRRMRLPSVHSAARPVPGRKEIVVLLGDYQIGIADPDTGRLRTLEGHPNGRIDAIGFRGDTVITVADTLRVWRAGAMIEAGPPVTYGGWNLVTAPPTAPILVDLKDVKYDAWTPGTGVAPVPAGLGFVADRVGDRAMEFGADDDWSVRAGTIGNLVPIFTPADSKTRFIRFFAVDLTRGEIVMEDEQVLYVLTPATKRLVALQLACDRGRFELAHAHFAPRLVATSEQAVFRFDSETGAQLGSQAAKAPIAATFVSADEIAYAAEDRVVLWGAGHTIAAKPKLPTKITTLAVDRERALIAIGHADGAFEIEALDELRARATPIASSPAGPPKEPCDAAIAHAYDELAQ